MATLTSTLQRVHPETSLEHGGRQAPAEARIESPGQGSVPGAAPAGRTRLPARRGTLWARAWKRVLAAFNSLAGPPTTARERSRREAAQAQVSRYQGMSGVWNQRC